MKVMDDDDDAGDEMKKGNLSKGVFERRTPSGSRLLTFLSSGFAKIFS